MHSDASGHDDLRYVISPDLRQHAVGEWVAVYNRKWGGLCFLDSEAHEFLLQFATPRQAPPYAPSDDDAPPEVRLLQQLMLRQLVVATDRDAVPLQPARPGAADGVRSLLAPVAPPAEAPPKVNVVQLVLVNACNFGCTYCFEGVQGTDLEQEKPKLIQLKKPAGTDEARAGETVVNLYNSVYASPERHAHQRDPENRLMEPDKAVEYVARAIDVARGTGTTRLMIQFFGGEPLMNWPAIRAVLDAFGDGAAHGVGLDYTIVTNGSLIRPEVAQAFHDHQVGVCVSFDSATSSSRPLKNGKDSRPMVLKGLRQLQAHKVRVALNAALSMDTWDEFGPELVDFALDHGIHEIGVVVDLDPGFYEKHGSAGITEKLWTLVEAGRQNGVVVTGYWHQIFQLLNAFAAVPQRGFKNCSAKGAQLSIEPNGAVFSCKAGSGYFGSIEDEELLTSPVYRQHSALRHQNPAFCNGCEIEGFCAGLCLGPLEKKFNSIDTVEPAACGFYRNITRKFIEAQRPYEIATFHLADARKRAASATASATASASGVTSGAAPA
jgi:uncharacterized protein